MTRDFAYEACALAFDGVGARRCRRDVVRLVDYENIEFTRVRNARRKYVGEMA